MSFEQQIQQWVTIDNQMKLLNDKMKELRDKKNIISEQINSHVETTSLSNAAVKISDGQLKFIKVKETQQLTFKYLETCLSEIIKNEEQVQKIVEYIKNKRDVKYVPEIKRFYSK
jgi:vacuolar-type H+-ATPase subunit H